MSRTTSVLGRAQQTSTCPSAGASSGSGAYVTPPDRIGVMQVWQTPVRQDQRVGTSQASARSSTFWLPSGNGTAIPLRAKVTNGPVPGRPGGLYGGPASLPLLPGLVCAEP